jgi:O-antigen ligase
MKKEGILRYLDHFLLAILLLFLTSIVFSFRAVSSISIGLILTIGLAKNRGILNHLIYHKALTFFWVGCTLLFILQCISLLYTKNFSEGARLLQRSSGIIFIPLAVVVNKDFLTEKFQKLSLYFSVILCVGSLYCLATDFAGYIEGAPISIFFYHDLVKPLSQHAIQFSIMVFIALVFMIENLKQPNGHCPVFSSRVMISFLSLIIVLLSSKLVISMYVLYLLYFFFNKKIHKVKSLALIPVFIIALTIAIATPNPLGNRFRELFAGNEMLFTQSKFSPATYFNGFQFRLLQWRFTYDILTEQHSWLKGLTPGDAQSFLDRKYLETNMYTGNPGTPDRGYLGYHTHNQFLQTLLENGLPALILFLFICFSFFKMAMECKSKSLKWLVLLLLIYCFTDAPLETQYGIVIFTFFPAFLSMEDRLLITTDILLKRSGHTLIKTVALGQPN